MSVRLLEGSRCAGAASNTVFRLPSTAGSAYDATQLAPATGTYVGCMFNDYMSLLRAALQQKPTGPVMTGGAGAEAGWAAAC